MPKYITLSDVNHQYDNVPLLRNVRITIDLDDNLVIIPKQSSKQFNDQKSAICLLRIIAGFTQPTLGKVKFDQPMENRILVAYRNFEAIFKRDGVKVDELVSTIIRTQTISNKNLDEIKELKSMLKINDFSNKLTNELSETQNNLLNLLTLLIVKPHAIALESLDLPGSDYMKTAILSYIKEYCDTYQISLIVVSDDKNVIETIADRKILISDNKIVSDVILSKKLEQLNKNVDNKTRAFDLEDAVIAISNNKVMLTDDDSIGPNFDEFNKETQDKLVKSVTKALTNSIEDDEREISSKNKASLTEDLFTNKYESSDSETNDLDDSYNDTIDLSERFTSSLEFKKEQIKQKTVQFNEESKDILEDIKIANKKSNIIPTKQVTKSLSMGSSQQTNKMQTGFLSDLKETYLIRKELQNQIRSDSFTSLNPDLQNKVYANFDRADQLIKETDPDGIYDPFKNTKNYDYSDDSSTKETVTKMIFEEEIFTSPIDDDIDTGFITRTSEFEEIDEEKTLDNIISNAPTDAYFDNEDDFTIKPTTRMFKTTKSTTTVTKKTSTTAASKGLTEEVTEEDQFYYDNEKPKKHRYGRFKKKEPDKEISEYIYGPKKSNKINTDEYEDTDEFSDFTQTLVKAPTKKMTSNLSYEDDDTMDFFEPTSRINDDFLDTDKFTSNKVNRPTRKFRTSKMTTDSDLDDDFDDYKPLKTMNVKSRTKKNSIERLYDEALEDAEIIEDIKGKRDKY